MMHLVYLVITDSGLGGLSICAGLAKRLEGRAAGARLRYVNAWPEETRGYNDLPDMSSRAAVFDRALASMTAPLPDRLLIACNTLSIVYGHTTFSRAPAVPVDGIIDAGVALFAEALSADPRASIVLLGTRATMASDVHRDRLAARGIDPARVSGVPCHGLATAIERDVHGQRVGELIAACAADVARARPAGDTILAGLCCTHYGYVADRIGLALEAALGRPVRPLDPNARMVDAVEAALMDGGAHDSGSVVVEVVSKVTLDERTRTLISALVAPVSPATAQALLSYTHAPDLF